MLTENGSLEWVTKINYFFSTGLMHVTVNDNRDPENYQEIDNYLAFSERIMTPEHLLYLLRFVFFNLGYHQEFHLNLTIAMEVVDEEEIETQAGYFACWVLEDKLWIVKDERLVIKAVKKQVEGPDVIYILEEKM